MYGSIQQLREKSSDLHEQLLEAEEQRDADEVGGEPRSRFDALSHGVWCAGGVVSLYPFLPRVTSSLSVSARSGDPAAGDVIVFARVVR